MSYQVQERLWFDAVVTQKVRSRTFCHDNFSYGYCNLVISHGGFDENPGVLSALKG